MHILSKSTYIKGLQCEKALYMTKKHPYLRDRLSIEQRAKFQRGTDVGILAHDCFPGGIDMSPKSPTQFPQQVKKTWENLSNPDINVMYEAVFQFNDTLIMLDILVRDGDRWRAIEVKSSLRLTDTYRNDAALQYYVLQGCGVPLSDFELMCLNGDYVKNGPIEVKNLFRLESVMEYVKEHHAEVSANVDRLKAVVTLEHAPITEVGAHCFDPYACDFRGHCWKNIIEDQNYKIDYKTLFSLAPDQRPRHIACLNLLIYRPAVPELDGTHPYQEMILAFDLQGEFENDGHTSWNCFSDHSIWHECINLLVEHLAVYDQVICFTPTNLTTTLMRHEIIQNQYLGYKFFNLFEILSGAQFFHPDIRNGFNLQNVLSAVFPDDHLFEHSRIILEALSGESTGYEQAMTDLQVENEAVIKLYQKFFGKDAV